MKTKKNLFGLLLATVCVSASALCFSACGHKHDYSDKWSHDAENHWHDCASCDDKSDLSEHSWNNGVTSKVATCTENGERTYTCTVCGETKVEQTEKAEHKWDDGVTVKQASCTEEGETLFTCTVRGCEETKTQPIALIEHSWDEGTVTVEATCQTAGVKTFRCTATDCNETKTEPIAVSTEHSWDEGTVTKESTCQTTGVKTFHCTVTGCDETKTETVNKSGHNPSTAWAYDSSEHWHACLTAGCTEHIGSTAHTWDEWVVTVQPTEETPGKKKRVCTQEGCGAFEEETVPELGHEHSYGDDYEKNATQHWQVCTGANCNETTEKQDHTYGTGVVIKPATALEEGTEKFTCTVCGYEKTETIAKIPAYIVRTFNMDGTPAEGVTVAINDKVAVSDADGYAIITGLTFADYPAFVQKTGYSATAAVTSTGEETEFEYTLVPSSSALTITESGTYFTYLKGSSDGNGGFTFDKATAKITLKTTGTAVFKVKMPVGVKCQETGSQDDFEKTIKGETYSFNLQAVLAELENVNGYAIVEFEVEVLDAEQVSFESGTVIEASAQPDAEKFFFVTKPSAVKSVRFELPEGVTAVCKWEVTDWSTWQTEYFTQELSGDKTLLIDATVFSLFVKSANGNISVKTSAVYDELPINAATQMSFDLMNSTKTLELTVTEANKYLLKADTTFATATINVYSATAELVATGNKVVVENLSAGKYLVEITVKSSVTVSFIARPYMDYDAGATPNSAQTVYSGDTKTIAAAPTALTYTYFTFISQSAGTLTLNKTAARNTTFYGDASCSSALVNKNDETVSVRIGANHKIWIRCANSKGAEQYRVEFEFTPFTEEEKVERTLTASSIDEPLSEAHIKITNGSLIIAEGEVVDGEFTFWCYPYDGSYAVELTLPEAIAEQYTITTQNYPLSFSATNLLGITKNMLFKVTVKGDDGKLLEGVTVNAALAAAETDAEGKAVLYGTGTVSNGGKLTLGNIPEGYKGAASYTVSGTYYSEQDGCFIYECVLETPKAHIVKVSYGENPAKGVKVSFLSGGVEAANAVTDEKGVATLSVFKGAYTMLIEDYDTEYYYSGRLPSVSATVQEYELTLAEAFCDYSVTVNKYDGTKVEGALAYLYEGGIIVGAAYTDENGEAVFSHFKVGTAYKVTVSACFGLDGVANQSFSGTEASVTLYPEGTVKGLTAGSLAATYAALPQGKTMVVAAEGANGFSITEPNVAGSNGAKYTITLDKGVGIESLIYHASRASATDSTQIIKDGDVNAAYSGANSKSVEVKVGTDGKTVITVEVANNYKLFMKLTTPEGYGFVTVEREAIEASE